MNNRDNLLGVLAVMYRWRKAIRNVCLLTLVGSIAIALTLENYYKSVTVFYPASPQLANPELIFGFTSQVTEYFGSDRDLDRIAEIANGTEVADYMIKEFNLSTHYGIDTTRREGPNKVREQFRNLYSALKNKNDAIELSMEDTDPRMSAKMANAAREKINSIGQRLIKDSQSRLIATFEENIGRKMTDLEKLGDSLQMLQAKYNIYSVSEQGEQLATQLATAESQVIHNKARLEVLEGNPNIPRDTIAYIKADLRAYEREREELMTPNPKGNNLSIRSFNEGLPKVSILTDLHYQARKQLSYDKERCNQIKAAYNTVIPAVQVVEVAETPLIKSRPKRSVLVIGAVFAAFVFTLLAALIAEAYRDVKWSEVTRPRE